MALEIELSDVLDVTQLETAISQALETRAPFSFVRVSDGEGMALARPGALGDPMRPSIIRAFGPAFDQAKADALGEELDAAVRNASILGLRPEVRYLALTEEDFLKPEAEFLARYKACTDGFEPPEKKHLYQSALRLGHLVHELERLGVSKTRAVTHAWGHLELLASGYLARLVVEAPRLILISCRRKLARMLVDTRDRPTRFFPVLEVYGREKRFCVSPEHWWQSMVAVADSLTEIRPGDVFLIGAGIWGKAFCERVRARGGIAIDIGSAVDIWAGIHSRPGVMPLVFSAYPDTPEGEVSKELRLDPQVATWKAKTSSLSQ